MLTINEKSLWKNKDFLILWGGQTASVFGTSVNQITYQLLILYLTNSPILVGVGTAFFTVPTFVFGLFSGALVDRLDRKKIMIICDLGRFTATASIPVAAVFGHLTLWQIYIASFVEGVCGTFFYAAVIAAMPRVAGKEKLTDAISKAEVGSSAAEIVGPSIGGFLYQTVGRTVPYIADAVSYIVSVISLSFIKTDFQEKRTIEEKSLIAEILEGLTWLWRHPVIRILTLLTAGGALIASGQNLVILLIAKNLNAGAAAIGTIFSIGAIGSLLGAFAANRVHKRFNTLKVIIAARWFMALILPLYLLVPNTLVLGIITALYFVASPIYGVLLAGYRTSLTPDQLQGRVASVYRMIILGGYSAGGIIAGFLLEKGGTNITIILFSIFLLALAVIASFSLSGRKTISASV